MEKNQIDAVTEKERQCIAMTSATNVPERPRVIKELIDPFADVLREPVWLLPIFIPLATVLAPFQLIDSIRTYKRKRQEYLESWSKYYEFNGRQGDKHILILWDEYGFESRIVYQADDNKRKLAACISEWLRILYSSKYHLTSGEILAQFEHQRIKQAQHAAELREQKGILINMVDPYTVVIKKIFSSLPEYA